MNAKKKYEIFQWFSSLIMVGWWLCLLDLFEINHKFLKKLYESIFKDYFTNNIIYKIYDYRLKLLFFLSIVFLFFYFINNRKKIFKELEDEQYQSKEYHKNLVNFLNEDSYNGSNIFWLNGSWGSGKTRFLNAFFENQKFGHNNIYKISCFGLKTRERLERNLREQIENKSTFYFLQSFPLIGDLLSYISQEVGLRKIKKHSIIIFDDLERVAVFLNQKQFIYVNGRYELIEEDKETIVPRSAVSEVIGLEL